MFDSPASLPSRRWNLQPTRLQPTRLFAFCLLLGLRVSIADAFVGVWPGTEHGKVEYLLNDIAVGDYFITIAAPGFETYSVEGLPIDADANVRTDARLKPGSVNEQVTVESSSVTLDARSATPGQNRRRCRVGEQPAC